MMRELLLLRHAQAEEHAPSDHARALAKRGVAQAEWVGDYLASENLVPELVLCSSALRTRQTWAEISRVLGAAAPEHVQFLDELYEASSATVSNLVSSHGGSHARVLIIGHEPIMSLTAQAYADQSSDRTALFAVQAGMPTAGIAQISLNQWHDVSGSLVALVRPDTE